MHSLLPALHSLPYLILTVHRAGWFFFLALSCTFPWFIQILLSLYCILFLSFTFYWHQTTRAFTVLPCVFTYLFHDYLLKAISCSVTFPLSFALNIKQMLCVFKLFQQNIWWVNSLCVCVCACGLSMVLFSEWFFSCCNHHKQVRHSHKCQHHHHHLHHLADWRFCLSKYVIGGGFVSGFIP